MRTTMHATPNATIRTLPRRRRLPLALAGFAALVAAVPALAQDSGEGRDTSRINVTSQLELAADATFEARKCTLRVVRKQALANQQMKVVLTGVSSDEELDLYMENESGAMVQVGEFTARGRNSLVWRVRTKKGEALPFGVADVAELSARRIEIRAEGESAAYVGECPEAEPTAEGGKRARASASLSISAEVALFAEGANDDEPGTRNRPIRAEIELRRKRNGTEQLEIELKNAAAGLSLTAYMESAFGVMLPIGTLEPEGDHEDSTDCDYALDFQWVASAYTLGVVSISDLAGNDIEIRTESGAVLAVGTVPAVKPDEQPADDGGSDAGEGETSPGDDGESGDDGEGDDDGIGGILGGL